MTLRMLWALPLPRLGLALAIVMVATAGIATLKHGALAERVAEMRDQNTRLEEELEALKGESLQLNTMRAQPESVAILNRKIHTRVGQSENLVALHRIVEQSGVRIERDESKSETRESVVILERAIRLSGSYAQTKAFLAGIPSLPGVSLVTEMAIERDEARRGVRALVRLKTYYATDDNP